MKIVDRTIKAETYRKIKNIATAAYHKYGEEVVNVDNSHILYYDISKRTGNKLTRITLNNWINLIDDLIKKMNKKDIKKSLERATVSVNIEKIPNDIEKQQEEIINDEPIERISIFYKNGEYKDFMNYNDLVDFLLKEKSTPKEEEELVKKYKEEYTGLFHYIEGGVMINKHTYQGCWVIKDGRICNDDIEKTFTKVDFISPHKQLKDWMIHQLNYFYSGKLDSYHKNGIRDIEDTKRDVKFMIKFLKSVWDYEYLTKFNIDTYTV
jgi:hypothetical protein